VLFPPFQLGIVSSTQVYIRVDDVLILCLALATVLRYAEGGILLRPVTFIMPFVVFISFGTFSLLRGLFINTIDKPIVSLLVMAKWIEYLFLSYMGQIYITERKALIKIISVFLLCGVAVILYGYWEFAYPKAIVPYLNYYRLFDRGIFLGQNNHIGGFLVMWFSMITAIFLETDNIKEKMISAWTFIIGVLPFLATYSRKSYIALMVTLTVVVSSVGKKRYLVFLLVGSVCVSVFFGLRFFERIKDIVNFFFTTDQHQSQRYYFLRNFFISLRTLESFPFLGAGFGSRHRLFYESQWIMVAAETGILGLGAFGITILMVLRESFLAFKRSKELTTRIFTLCCWAGIVGILIHSLTCLSLVVTRIAVSFWIFAGIVSGLGKESER
jgi:hypothetical protein